MRKLLLILTLLLTANTISAQTRNRGLALGADRDTVKFLIASPFDNWYINIGGGMQTFIGNEHESSARRNKLNFNAQVEIGKWIIPDVAFSLRYSIFNVDGQTRYGLNPFVDFTGLPFDENGERPYLPFHAYAMSFMGFFSFDWTNFINGYEDGKQAKIHWRSSIGLGMSMLFGNQVNPQSNSGNYAVGDFRRNFELAFAISGGIEYSLTEHFAIFSRLEFFGSESTWDWSPYDNSHTIFDIIPSINAGVRFNLLSYVTKYHHDTKITQRDSVFHEFQTIGSSNVVTTLNGKIDHLQWEKQQQLDNSNRDANTIDSLNKELARTEALLKRYESENDGKIRPHSLIDELIDINQALSVPSAVIYFELDKYNLDYNARKRLQEFSKKALSLADTIEYYMIGAADSLTGSIVHNQWLSERRCEAAYNMLTDNYGLSGNQLIKIHAGGINDYTPQENNRMVYIIQRTPVTEEIVERWLRMSKERMERVRQKDRR